MDAYPPTPADFAAADARRAQTEVDLLRRQMLELARMVNRNLDRILELEARLAALEARPPSQQPARWAPSAAWPPPSTTMGPEIERKARGPSGSEQGG